MRTERVQCPHKIEGRSDALTASDDTREPFGTCSADPSSGSSRLGSRAPICPGLLIAGCLPSVTSQAESGGDQVRSKRRTRSREFSRAFSELRAKIESKQKTI